MERVWIGKFSKKKKFKVNFQVRKTYELEKRLKDAELERNIKKKQSAFFIHNLMFSFLLLMNLRFPRRVDDI